MNARDISEKIRAAEFARKRNTLAKADKRMAELDRIEVPHADRTSKTRGITIVYHFIGAFGFSRAIEEARNTTQKQQKTA